MRRDPTSIGSIVYHSQTCFGLVDADGEYHYVRYRLQPLSFLPDGTPTPDDMLHPWFQNPLPTETRNRNYLKDAARERLARRHDRVHVADPGRDASRPVRTRRGPPPSTCGTTRCTRGTTWRTSCSTRRSTTTEAMLTVFELTNHPPCLPVATWQVHRRPALVERSAHRRPLGDAGTPAQLSASGASPPSSATVAATPTGSRCHPCPIHPDRSAHFSSRGRRRPNRRAAVVPARPSILRRYSADRAGHRERSADGVRAVPRLRCRNHPVPGGETRGERRAVRPPGWPSRRHGRRAPRAR